MGGGGNPVKKVTHAVVGTVAGAAKGTVSGVMDNVKTLTEHPFEGLAQTGVNVATMGGLNLGSGAIEGYKKSQMDEGGAAPDSVSSGSSGDIASDPSSIPTSTTVGAAKKPITNPSADVSPGSGAYTPNAPNPTVEAGYDKKRGLAANMLTGSTGLDGDPTTSRKKLLGE